MNPEYTPLPADCRSYLASLDAAEPLDDGHIATCEACAREKEVRSNIMNRARMAHESLALPVGLETRIRAALAAEQRPPKTAWLGAPAWMAAATAFALVASFGIAYQLGYLRWTSASQDSYIASVSSRVASILRVGLKDHIHCTIYRQYPKNPPPVEHFAADLGPEYRALIPVVRQQAPAGYQLIIGHKCRYDGRQFVHLALKNSSGQILSLVIARKGQGESFQTERLPAALAHNGQSFFEGQAQRFAISAFETDSYLVYTVSDLPGEQNMRVLVALAPQVSEVLARSGS